MVSETSSEAKTMQHKTMQHTSLAYFSRVQTTLASQVTKTFSLTTTVGLKVTESQMRQMNVSTRATIREKQRLTTLYK